MARLYKVQTLFVQNVQGVSPRVNVQGQHGHQKPAINVFHSNNKSQLMVFRAKLFIAVVPGELPVTPDKERIPGKLVADAGGKLGLLCDQIVDLGFYQSNVHGGFKHVKPFF